MPNLDLQRLLAGKTAALPAAAAGASPAASAAVAAVVPQVVLPDTGSPQSNLKNLLTAFATKAGSTPKVNPPEAAKVLAVETMAEAGGAPQPDEDDKGPPVEPPTSKPQEVLDAENAKRPRRTAAVVQEELDLANASIATLQASCDQLREQMAGYAAEVRKEFAAETELGKQDNAKLAARCEALQAQLEEAEVMNASAVEMIQGLQNGAPVASAAPVEFKADHLQCEELVHVLASRGFKVTLEVLPA